MRGTTCALMLALMGARPSKADIGADFLNARANPPSRIDATAARSLTLNSIRGSGQGGALDEESDSEEYWRLHAEAEREREAEEERQTNAWLAAQQQNDKKLEEDNSADKEEISEDDYDFYDDEDVTEEESNSEDNQFSMEFGR